MHRFRFLGIPISDGEWQLSDHEARHARDVLRLESGELIEIADGQGTWCLGHLSWQTTHTGNVKIIEKKFVPEPSGGIHLAVGGLENANVEELIPGLSEIGIHTLHVFMQEHTHKKRFRDQKVLDRYQRLALQSLKQCKRSWKMNVMVHDNLQSALKQTQPGSRRFAFDNLNEACVAKEFLRSQSPESPIELLGVVGSEKGFSAAEINLLKTLGVQFIRFDGPVMRATTACLCAAFWLKNI